MSRAWGIVNRLRSRREVERVAIVAAIGVLFSWISYEILYFINPFEPRATISWSLSFVLGIVRQHHLHRSISFPGRKSRYRTSLGRDFTSNLLILALTAGLSWTLTVGFLLNHQLAWLACMIFAAGANYAAMKLFVFRDSAFWDKASEGPPR